MQGMIYQYDGKIINSQAELEEILAKENLEQAKELLKLSKEREDKNNMEKEYIKVEADKYIEAILTLQKFSDIIALVEYSKKHSLEFDEMEVFKAICAICDIE